MPSAERKRVASFGRPEDGLVEATPWYHWGPYLSERAWGTVREDYSATGEAWDYFPHDHARSRAYRWGEDGMAGVCDVEQRLCLALALWNGRDPILKERMFGLTGPQGNHGEDVKEYWWYLDALAQPRLAALALPLPAGRVPLRRPGRRERPARPARPRVRAAGHRRVRRRPLLGGRRRPRQGGPARPADGGAGHQRRPGPRLPARAAAPVVPQHLVLGRRAGPARPFRPPEPTGSPSSTPGSGSWCGRSTPAPTGNRPTLLFCDNETNGRRLFGADAGAGLPQGRHQRPRRPRRTHGEPRPDRHQERCLVPAGRGPGRDPDGAGPAAPAVADQGLRQEVRRGPGQSAPRGRRVLRRGHPRDGLRRRPAGGPPGVRRDDLGQAVLLLRRGALAGGRPHPAAASAGAPVRAEPGVGPPGRPRHPVDARSVGVPLVRRLGPRLPHRHAGPRRPGVRQVPAAGHGPGVVPAPQRGDPRLRVGLRRRQPAGARVGGPARVGHRRAHGHRLPRPPAAEAAGELHLVGEPDRPGG